MAIESACTKVWSWANNVQFDPELLATMPQSKYSFLLTIFNSMNNKYKKPPRNLSVDSHTVQAPESTDGFTIFCKFYTLSILDHKYLYISCCTKIEAQ
jgi:hypothetical protein